jgi:precorrin-2 dehydrogenase/sirohydrochlorin ferrochelatase
MRHLPVFLDVGDRCCLVVGGGTMAMRKVDRLLRAGARVSVVAPEISPELERMAAAEPRLRLHRRAYEASDLEGSWLAFAATNDGAVQERVARDAARAGVWLNAVDEPARCSFHMPAILERGPVTVAVGTGGASPLLAGRLRDEIGERIGPEYGEAARHLSALRARFAPGEARRQAFERLLESGLLEALRRGDAEGVAEMTRLACAGLEDGTAAEGR